MTSCVRCIGRNRGEVMNRSHVNATSDVCFLFPRLCLLLLVRAEKMIPTPRDQPYSVHESDCQKHFRDLFSISMEWCYYIFSASTHQQPDERRLPLLVSFTVTKSPSHFESLQSFISLAMCLFIVFFSLFQAIVFIFLGVHEKGVILPPFIPRIFFALSPSTVSLTASVCFSPLLWVKPFLLYPQFLFHLPPNCHFLCSPTSPRPICPSPPVRPSFFLCFSLAVWVCPSP